MKKIYKQVKIHPFYYDRWIMASVLLLLAMGLLMVASASMVVSDKQFGYPFHYIIHQAFYLLIGLFLMFFCTRVPMSYWQKISSVLFLIALFLLVIVLIPGVGRVVNGSRRWLNFGVITLQVSEIMKFCAILYLASYLERFQNQVRTEFIGFLKPMVLLGVICILLLLEPDFGAATIITVTFMALLFISGVRIWPFVVLLLLVAAAMALLAVVSPYRMQRITTFLNPWSHAFGSGYQLTQSLIAFGRGGVLGVGLGNSVQKLFYLPEAHTDFLFAVLGEELGMLGELFIIILFVILVGRMLRIGFNAQQKSQFFSSYLVFGLAFWIGLQALVNMGVNCGLLPTKGLTLPFMSYGGSSMLINFVLIGVVMRISYEISFVDDKISSFCHRRLDY